MPNQTIPANRAFAIGRALLAAFILTINIFVREDMAEFGLIFLFLSICYAALSLFVLLVSFTSWLADFIILPATIVFEIAFFIVMTFFVLDANTADLFVHIPAFLAFAAFLHASLQFFIQDRRAVISVFAVAFLAALVAAFSDGGSINPTVLAVVPLIIAGMIAWAAVWGPPGARAVRLPPFMEEALQAETPLVALLLDYAKRNIGASDAALCWFDHAQSRCYVVRSGTMEIWEPQPLASFDAPAALRDLVPMMFDTKLDRSITYDCESNRADSAERTVRGRELFAQLGIARGICMPLDLETDIRPWLVLSGIRAASWGHLPVAHAISQELTTCVNWFEEAQGAKLVALGRLRRTMASDLHDSVAQSLAGAKLFLSSIKSKFTGNGEAAASIDDVCSSLEAEYVHIRNVIGQLRDDGHHDGEADMIADFESESRILKGRWGVDIAFEQCDERVRVPMWISMEAQQIMREAVSNGVRHGGATRITVSCRTIADILSLKIWNNNTVPQTDAQGRTSESIRQRVMQLGGTLNVESDAAGTSVNIEIDICQVYDLSRHLRLKGQS